MSSDDVKKVIKHMDAQHLETMGRFAVVDKRLDAIDKCVDGASSRWQRDESAC